jgi:hypothetical protein
VWVKAYFPGLFCANVRERAVWWGRMKAAVFKHIIAVSRAFPSKLPRYQSCRLNVFILRFRCCMMNLDHDYKMILS